jgi:hypothetical protein
MDSVVVGGVVGNVLSVVGIVLMNKYITDVDGFNFMVFLSFLHFAFTSIGMYVFLLLGFFDFTPVTVLDALPVAVVRVD